jgi:hypothetical protein
LFPGADALVRDRRLPGCEKEVADTI